jgi:hypothetical protein
MGRGTSIGWKARLLVPISQSSGPEQHIVEGNHVATLFEEDTVDGPLPVFSLWEIHEGRIKDVRVFYDPRRIKASPQSGQR